MPPQSKQITTADGIPLKVSLRRAERAKKIRACLLIAPTFLFILIAFLVPIATMLFQSVNIPEIAQLMPKTVAALKSWDGTNLPDEPVYAALAGELKKLKKERTLGKVALRLNYEASGMRSLLRKTASILSKKKRKKAASMLAVATQYEEAGAGTGKEPGDVSKKAVESADVKQASQDKKKDVSQKIDKTQKDDKESFKDKIIKINKRWGDRETWAVIKRLGKGYSFTYYLSTFDMEYDADGNAIKQPESQRVHIIIWIRTLWVSLLVTFSCLLMGYPVSYLLSTLPLRISSLLMICVLLPFWTSLLVRITSWIVLLQKEGVINDLLVWFGLVADENRIRMVYNMTGTIVAMTQILLPFMILPLYSVMKTISPSYVRAARSLGANPFRAFYQIYLPQTVPGIGAGGILVFILAIGYYITPALVGGAKGMLIGNFIALHMQKTLNWGLASAMGVTLLVAVLAIYWLYNRIVGIENMKLG